jgi:polyisoprenoid-binding protein YceI
MRLIVALFLLYSCSVSATWTLENANSSLNFISTKNNNLSELHSFDQFSGQLTSSGKLSVSVNLASVNTLIEIRNSRMQKMLFEVGNYATAELSAQLPVSIMAATVGKQSQFDMQGQLTLHGVSLPITMQISVAKLDADTYSAHTVKPIIISADQFGLKDGVEALREIAGLNNISLAVPVTFSVLFTRA